MRSAWSHYWIAMAVLTVAMPLPAYLGNNVAVPLNRPLADLDYQLGDWQGKDEGISERAREVLNSDDILMRTYRDPSGAVVYLYVSYFERQQRGEISHSPRNCLPGAGWQRLEAQRVAYPLPGVMAGDVNEMVFDKAGQRQLVYYWFQERGRVLASEYLVKWYLIWDVITRHRSDGALVRISAAVRGSESATREALQRFMQIALPQINEFLPNQEAGS
jgi:EpsI family protein